LQEDARRRAWRLGGGAETPVAATERRLRAALEARASDAVVADLVLDGDDVLAVRVSATGSRLVRLAPQAAVAEQVRRARADFAVLSNVLIPVPMREAAVASIGRTLAALDDVLVAPLEADGDLHVAARDLLLAVPWASLPSRRGRRTWANSWVDLRVGESGRRADDALVVAGPGLRFSSAEAKLVASVWDGSDALTGEDATCAAVLDGLGPAGDGPGSSPPRPRARRRARPGCPPRAGSGRPASPPTGGRGRPGRGAWWGPRGGGRGCRRPGRRRGRGGGGPPGCPRPGGGPRR